MLVTEQFVNLAKVTFKAKGASSTPMIVLPPTQVTAFGDDAQSRAVLQTAIDEIVAKVSVPRALEA